MEKLKSKYPNPVDCDDNIADIFIELEKKFVARLAIFTPSSFRPKNNKENVEYVYNPLDYAANLHNQYVKKYCDSTRKIMFLGMNPGPFGMVQTGVSVLYESKDVLFFNYVITKAGQIWLVS